MEIVELRAHLEYKAAFPLIHQLRPYLTEGSYLDLLGDMIPDGYRMFAIRDEDSVVAVAGVALRTNLYHGRHVWVYDLVTDERLRSHGLGQQLLEYIESFARKHGCERVSLASGMQRTEAHRFYEQRMGYERPSYLFTKKIG